MPREKNAAAPAPAGAEVRVLLGTVVAGGKDHGPGETLVLSAEEAEDLVARGVVELVAEPAAAPAEGADASGDPTAS